MDIRQFMKRKSISDIAEV